jgi:hypothetical protein
MMYCWNLPAQEHSSLDQQGPEVTINNGSGRQCAPETMNECPGHPWVKFNYQVSVQQWQEKLEMNNNHHNSNSNVRTQEPSTTNAHIINRRHRSRDEDDEERQINEKRQRFATYNGSTLGLATSTDHDSTNAVDDATTYKVPQVEVIDPLAEPQQPQRFPWQRSQHSEQISFMTDLFDSEDVVEGEADDMDSVNSDSSDTFSEISDTSAEWSDQE